MWDVFCVAASGLKERIPWQIVLYEYAGIRGIQTDTWMYR